MPTLRAIALDPNYALAYYHRGIINLRQEDWLEAIQDFDRAIELQPDNYRAYFNSGFSYIKLHEWDKAKEKYDRGISINPNDGKAYINRSIAQSRLRNPAKAIVDLQRAKKIFEKTGDLLNLQQVEKRLKQYQPTLVPRQLI